MRRGSVGGRLESAVDVLHEHVPLVVVELLDRGLDLVLRFDREQDLQDQLEGSVLERIETICGSMLCWLRLMSHIS